MAESLCYDELPEGPQDGALFAAFNATAEGTSDGSVGIYLPGDGETFEYWITTEVRFEGSDAAWSDGPFTGLGGEYVEWTVDVSNDVITSERQLDYLSDVLIYVEVYADGVFAGRTSAGYARVAFDLGIEPLIMLPDQAAELAPGDAWNLEVAPRVEYVSREDVAAPPPPLDPDEGPNSEEDGE